MYKLISLVIMAAIVLSASVAVALYTGSEANAQAAGANMTKNATAAAGANMTKNATAGTLPPAAGTPPK